MVSVVRGIGSTLDVAVTLRASPTLARSWKLPDGVWQICQVGRKSLEECLAIHSPVLSALFELDVEFGGHDVVSHTVVSHTGRNNAGLIK